MATTKNIGQILIDKAKELDPTYKPDKFNDMGEAAQIILDNMGRGETDAIELNLNDGSWEMQENSDGTTFTKTCSDEENASLSVNNVRLAGTVQLWGIDIDTSTFGIFDLMHANEFLNAWNQKTFICIFGNLTVTIDTFFKQLSVTFLNKTLNYNRQSLQVYFAPVKTTAEHYYKVYIIGTQYSNNVNYIDSVQFKYPIDKNQELAFPVIQKSGSDAIKNIVSTVYNGHIYEIHFSKDNPGSPDPESLEPSDKDNKLIIRHMDGTVDNDAIGQNTIYGNVELHGYTLFTD